MQVRSFLVLLHVGTPDFGSLSSRLVRATPRIRTPADRHIADWVVEHLRRLDDGRLGATRIDALATRIVDAAVHLDRHGHLTDGWAEFSLRPATRSAPVIEIEVPGR